MFNPGIRIYQYRLQKGLTQAQLASQCGIPQPNLSNIEKGKQDLTVSTLIRIAGALEVRPGQFLEEEKSKWEKPILTRKNVESIAEAILNPKARVSKKLHYWAEFFRIILPQSASYAKSSSQKINVAWLKLKETFTSLEIKTIGQKVNDRTLA